MLSTLKHAEFIFKVIYWLAFHDFNRKIIPIIYDSMAKIMQPNR